MAQDDRLTRYEINRNVRMILTRHDADLTKIDYSCMGNTVYLYGDLVRSDRDYVAKEIDFIVGEITALSQVRNIQLDLNNWIVDSSGNAKRITKSRESSLARSANQSDASDVVIDKAEKLADVLDDLDPGSKKEEATHQK